MPKCPAVGDLDGDDRVVFALRDIGDDVTVLTVSKSRRSSQPRKKSLSKILCFLRFVALAPDKSVKWLPIDSAKLFERRGCCRRVPSGLQDNAPMRGGKQCSAVFSARRASCGGSYLIEWRDHIAIPVGKASEKQARLPRGKSRFWLRMAIARHL